MIRLTMAVLIGLSLSLTAFVQGPGVRQAEGYGGRVEMTRLGYAVTFPDDWYWAEPSRRDVLDIYPVDDDHDATTARQVGAIRSGEIELGLLANGPRTISGSEQSCHFLSSLIGGSSLQSLVFWELVAYLDDPSGEPETTYLDLPAGQVARLDSTYPGEDGGAPITQAHYIFSDGVMKHSVSCTSADPPEDQWLEIAETFEFLFAPEATPSPSPPPIPVADPIPPVATVRYERPWEEFELSAPEDWTITELTSEDHARMFSHLDEDGQALRRSLIQVDVPDGDDYCFLIDIRRLAELLEWQTIDEATEWFGRGWDGDGSAETAIEMVALPSGRTGNVTVARDDGWHYDGYYFSDLRRWMYMGCWTWQDSERDYRTLASSFQFVPAVVPSTSADVDVAPLAARFPASVYGQPMAVDVWDGGAWIERLEGDPSDIAAATEAVQALAETAGVDVDHVTVATALVEPRPGQFATVAAVQVPGRTALEIIDLTADLLAHADEPRRRWRTTESGWAQIVRDRADPGAYSAQLFPTADTVWVVHAGQSLAAQLIDALPAQGELRTPLAPGPRAGEAGLVSIRLPIDWETTWLHGEDVAHLRAVTTKQFPEDLERYPVAVSASSPEAGRAVGDQCSLTRYAPTNLSAEAFLGAVWGDAYYANIESLAPDLAYQTIEPTSPLAGNRFHEIYARSGDGHMALLWCTGDDPPGSTWRVIAESVELEAPPAATVGP